MGTPHPIIEEPPTTDPDNAQDDGMWTPDHPPVDGKQYLRVYINCCKGMIGLFIWYALGLHVYAVRSLSLVTAVFNCIIIIIIDRPLIALYPLHILTEPGGPFQPLIAAKVPTGWWVDRSSVNLAFDCSGSFPVSWRGDSQMTMED